MARVPKVNDLFHQQQLFFEGVKDHFETISRGAYLLLIAHGAGLVGCVTLMKESSAISASDVTVASAAFGSGFMAAISGYGINAVCRLGYTAAMVGEEGVRPSFHRFFYRTTACFLLYSMLSLNAAVWAVMSLAFKRAL